MGSRPRRLGLETYKRLVTGTQRLGLGLKKIGIGLGLGFQTRPGILVYFVGETITRF